MSYEYWEKQLEERLDMMVDDMEKIRRVSGRERLQCLTTFNGHLRMAKDARKNCDRAVRSNRDNDIKMKLKEKLRVVDQRVKDLEDEAKRAELDLDHNVRLNAEEKASNEEYLQSIHEIQGKTRASLQAQANQLDETLKVAGRTADQLEAQTGQLKDIKHDADRVRTNISRADRFVRRFRRQVEDDKVLKGLILLNFLTFIGLVTTLVLKFHLDKKLASL